MPKKGYKHTEEAKKNISKAMRKRDTPEFRIKMKEACKKRGEEWKKHVSEAKIGLVPWNKGKEDEKGRISKLGSKNPSWKGGITDINHAKRNKSKAWKRAVKKRDGFACVLCGSKEKLHAHHVYPFSIFVELRNSIENGITTCSICHRKIHSYIVKIQESSLQN